MTYTKEAKYGSKGRMYAEIYIDEQPGIFPSSSDDIPDIKNGYRFTTGSILYVVNAGDVYMYNQNDEMWVKQ